MLHGEALHLPVRRERRVAANANRQYGWKIDKQGCIFEFRIGTSLASRWHLPRIDLQHPPIRYPAIIRLPYTYRHRYLRRQHIRCYRCGVIGPPCDIPFEIHRKKPIRTGRLRFTFNEHYMPPLLADRVANTPCGTVLNFYTSITYKHGSVNIYGKDGF